MFRYFLYGIELYANTCCSYLHTLTELNNMLLQIHQGKI